MTPARFVLAADAPEKKKKPGRRELLRKFLGDSRMDVFLDNGPDGNPARVFIALAGSAARIPAAKNSKIPGLNIPNPETLAKVATLDALWFQRFGDGNAPTFGREPVFVVVISGSRGGRSFDTDNVYTTVRDWFEPRTKPVGKRTRGWGIGLVENDAQIRGVSVLASDLGLATDRTFILVTAWRNVAGEFADMIFSLGKLEELRNVYGGFKWKS